MDFSLYTRGHILMNNPKKKRKTLCNHYSIEKIILSLFVGVGQIELC